MSNDLEFTRQSDRKMTRDDSVAELWYTALRENGYEFVESKTTNHF